ncbi:siderophore-interacting protein [Bifidobacterium mongoliense]|nr:siderophore-interacting protein [Bifidobacterium mongoliense]MDN6024768.1 siderophore-interacting protein [Bifidobacterium mongoliense]
MLHADEFRLRVVSTALECGGLMKRVTFSSCGRLPDALFEPAAWMRLWFRTETGREVQRAYTVAGFAPDHSTIDVSFYLHQTSGPAASWAQRVQSGATLDVSVLGSWPFHMNEHDDGVVLLGDETAFPALRAILSGLPDGVRAHVLLTGEHDLTEFIFPLVRALTCGVCRRGVRRGDLSGCCAALMTNGEVPPAIKGKPRLGPV